MQLARQAAPLAAAVVLQWLAAAWVARRSELDDAGALLTAAQVGLLLPLACGLVYAFARRLGGHRLGVFAALVWALGPLAWAAGVDSRYEYHYVDRLLAQALGLTDEPALPAAVAMLAAALFALRGGVAAAALAGAAATAALALDGSAVLFIAAPLIPLLAARQPLAVGSYLAALAPGIAVLAARALELPDVPGGAAWDTLRANEDGIREFFWSVRVLEWLPIAGLLAVARRSVPAAGMLGTWLGAFLAFRATDPDLTIGAGTLLPALLPVLPAYLLLTAAIPLLAPPVPSLRALSVPGRLRRASDQPSSGGEPEL
jgi:hypothetical protein